MSLELKGSVGVDVVKHVAKQNKKDDGNTSYITVLMDLTEEAATALGGKLFANGIFCGYVGGSGEALIVSAKPGKEISIKATHNLTVEGYTVQTKPQIVDLLLDTKQRRATVKLVVPIPHTAKKLCHRMLDLVGNPVSFEFGGVVQPELPGSNGEDKRHGFSKARKGNGAEQPEANA